MTKFPIIGIVTGVEAELTAFRPDLPREAMPLAGLRAERITHAGQTILLCCAGIGKVAAATAATALAAYGGAELLMVIGTAGKLDELPGDLFLLTHAYQSDFGSMTDDGLVHYTAGSWPIGPSVIEAFAALPLPECPLPRARIATGDVFVESGAHARRLRERLDVHLVDMETAAVAHAASLLGLPWLAIKACTDEANAESGGDFMANLERAARHAAIAAENLIEAL